MKRIVIALVTLIGFSGAAFADVTLELGSNADRGYSKVEATSYIAASIVEQSQYQVFNP